MAKASGQTAIASTEHGIPKGWVGKKLYCDEIGIKFIFGVEVYLTKQLEPKIRDNFHTILLAKNMDGIREINTLIAKSCQDDHFYYTNRVSFEEFCGLSNNIIKTSACLSSPLNHLSEDDPWFEKMVRNYDFLEVQPHACDEQAEFNKKLIRLSEQYNIPLVVGTDTHSSTPYKAECRQVLLLAKRDKKYDHEDDFDLTYKSYDKIVSMFKEQGVLSERQYTEALENTNRIADMCENFILDKEIKYPILYGSQENDEAVFEQLVWDMLEDKLNRGIIPRSQEEGFRSALKEELRVFSKIHMSGFMLSMSELIRWCKSNGIAIGTARGSVGGSRAAYVTDIIDLNPEQWHTVFSRFANEDRIEIGDIDIDCIDGDRPRIFEYIVNRFGLDKTARVASYGTLAEKSVIEEIFRAFRKHKDEFKYSLANMDKVKKEYESDPEKTREKYPDVFYYYDGLVGTKISQSVHPAGMVISPITLVDNYGVFNKDGENCLILDMEEAHEVSLAKYDFLILKTVQVIRDTCRYAGIPYPQTYEIDFDDVAVWKDMMKSPVGIFQMEGAFAFDSLKKFKTSSIFDMSLVTACIRPSGASYRNELLARKQHKNPSPMIDELLKDNLGYLIYQEDTIKFLQQICGLSGSDADNVRRAIGRKQRDRLEKALPEILEGYCSKSDKPRIEAEEEAKEFLRIIEDSADYQFGQNHSIAYCILGYFCAYMRYYHPIEFITAFLNNAANDEDIKNGTKLASLYKINVTNPKWGMSKGEYFFDKNVNVIAKGISSVKHLGEAVAEELYDLSQRKKYDHFCMLLKDLFDETSIDTRQVEILIKIDFFPEFGNQRELLRIMDFVIKTFKKGKLKKIKRSEIDGTPFEGVVSKFSSGTTKKGDLAKSYTILDIDAILVALEDMVLSVGMEDLEDSIKVQNFKDAMGYYGYTSGREEDRRKLYVMSVYELKRKSDGKQFGYSIITKSIGSGIEARFTVFNRVYNKDEIHEGDIILCKSFDRDGSYFTLLDYEHLI